MSQLWQDVRYGLRMMRRKPVLTGTAVATIALGVGANTSIFSLVNAVLLRPLPYEHSDRLVVVHESREGAQNTVSGHEFMAWRTRAHTIEHAALYNYESFNLTGDGEPEIVSALSVSGDFFTVLRTRPMVGRVLGPGDELTGAAPVALLSHRLWQRRFAADSAIVGRVIRLNDVPHTVVGVMPARASFDPELWVPLDLASEAQRVGRHGNFVLARLRPDVTVDQAQSDLARVSAQLEQELPDANRGHGVRVRSMHEDMVGATRRPLLIFMGAVAFILLIACANVAHLLLTRAAGREREFAIRTALGAGRTRLVRQALTESLLLGLAGGGAGLILALWIIDLLPALGMTQLPRLDELGLDRSVLTVTATLAMGAGLLSGLLPAWQSTKRREQLSWLSGSRLTVGPGGTFASTLIVSEIALAFILMVGAGLTIKSFVRLLAVETGFDAGHTLTTNLALPAARYAQPQRVVMTYDQLLEGVRALPGVQLAGAAMRVPVGPCCSGIAITIEGRPEAQPGHEPHALMNVVTPDYFRTLQIPLRRGRSFNAHDARRAVPLIRWWPEQPYPANFQEAQAEPVVIINEALAREFWPGEDPLGKRIRVLFSPWLKIVGVVGDVRQRSLAQRAEPELYLSHAQEPSAQMTIVLRTSGDATTLAGAVRTRIRNIDPDLPAGQLSSMNELVWSSVRAPRFNATLLGCAAALALTLALIGIYGVLSSSIALRTHEIGIRSALGADAGAVLRLVLGQAMRLAAAGIALGLLGAYALSGLLRQMLFEVEPADPLVFGLIALLLAAICLVASYLPTRRATRIDPLVALRSD